MTKSTAKTAFLTTRGFRDVLVLKEGGKYDPHDYSYDYPPPYIPRRYTFEIDERIDAQGNVVRPLDRSQARDVIRTLAQRKFEAVAVCLLWSIANGDHEKEIGRLIDAGIAGRAVHAVARAHPDRARISPRLDDRDRRFAQAADAAAPARDGKRSARRGIFRRAV